MAKAVSSETPMMQQHRTIKQKYPDAILLFRVGYLY
jgi:DNA mismatch repair protein MutS